MIEDLPGERWRSIDGFEDVYEVSDFGRIKSLERKIEVVPEGRRPYRITIRACILKPLSGRGWPQVTLWLNSARHDVRIATLVAGAFLGEPPPRCQLALLDGNLANTDLSNLAYLSKREIEARKLGRGTAVHSEAVGWSRLTRADVAAIRSQAGLTTQCELGERFGISQSRVSRIQLRKQWRHVS